MLLNRHFNPIHGNGMKVQPPQPTSGKQDFLFLPVQPNHGGHVETADGKQGQPGKQKAA